MWFTFSGSPHKEIHPSHQKQRKNKIMSIHATLLLWEKNNSSLLETLHNFEKSYAQGILGNHGLGMSDFGVH